MLILIWTLTCTQSCAKTDPADPALTSKPAHTCSPTIVTACMQNLLSQWHHRMCLHLIQLKMFQFSHVWGPPTPPPCMTRLFLTWPVRQHACSHCAKPQSHITSGCRDNRAPVLLPLSFPIVARAHNRRFNRSVSPLPHTCDLAIGAPRLMRTY